METAVYGKMKKKQRKTRGEWLIGLNTQNITYFSIVATEHKIFWTKNLEFSPPLHKILRKFRNIQKDFKKLEWHYL